MIESYIVLANRIRKELEDLDRVVTRTETAVVAISEHPENRDFYIDSAALNMHDVYTGFERIFYQIAATVDGSVPTSREWHRDLLRQMNVDLPELRPAVLSDEVMNALDEYLRFRHVVRNVYAFKYNIEQIERLVQQLRPVFIKAQEELFSFNYFLDRVGRD